MMAGNQYGQQWPQGQGQQYDPRNDQRQRQENGRGQDQGHYRQDYQRYNEHPQNRNGYGPGPTPAPPRGNDHAQWNAQQQFPQQATYEHEEPYYQQTNGYPQSPRREHFDQGVRPPHQYQYDERYRNNGQGRPPPQQHHSSESRRPPRDQGSHPPTPQKRSKPRERILREPSSPKNLGWDNPFPSFQAKKKPDEKEKSHERHGSLDEAMTTHSLNEHRNSGEDIPRPRTANSNRREAPRPATSHDRRPGTAHDPRQDIRRSPPQPQGFPMRPDRDSPDMNFQPPPVPRPQGAMNSPRMRPAEPVASRGPPPPGPPPQQPIPQHRPHPGPYNQRAAEASWSDRNIQTQRPPQNRPRNNHIHDEGYSSDYIPQSRAYVPPVERIPSGNHLPQAPQQDYHSDPYRRPSADDYNGRNQRVSNGVPNFDAIPTHANERSEDQVIAPQQPAFDHNTCQKPTYQSSNSFSGQPAQIDTKQIQSSPPNQTTSPLAEFSFGLPASTQPLRPGGNDYRTPVGPYRGGYDAQIPSSRPGAAPYDPSQPREQPNAQFPPRAASRNGMKQPMDHNAPQPPLPNDGQPYRSFSQDQYPPRPHTSNTQRPPPNSYQMMNPYDQDPTSRAPSAPAMPVPTDEGYAARGMNQQYQPTQRQGPPMRTVSQDNYSRGGQFQQPPAPSQAMRTPSQDNYMLGPRRSNDMNSAHPVPIRHYPTANAETSPDALPAHPTPVRAGQANGNAYATAQPQQQSPPQQPVQRRDISGPAPAVTIEELNSLRSMYTSNPGDYALGLKLAKKMVEAAKILSDENGRADPKTTAKNREKYIMDAHKLVKKLVAASYPDAMFYLADCHGQGMLGLAIDPKEAFTLYQSAAKLNHPQSAYRVAVCCELGSEDGGGTRRDPMKAMQWYKRAATLGDPPAMYKLGMILLKGLLGQQKNPREAVSWLKRAAERADKDNPHALHELGLLYESATPPDNILRDERYAFTLFQQAAELGYKYSQFRLGSAFEYGLLDRPIDARQSIAWYTRAAAQGEHQSELALSGWYLTGSEPLLTQSDTEAFLWARKAASSGLAKAEYAMGYFFEVGIGTAVDVEEAKRWYYRAASQNFTKARERLEELKRGAPKKQKTRMSRSNVGRQNEGECSIM